MDKVLEDINTFVNSFSTNLDILLVKAVMQARRDVLAILSCGCRDERSIDQILQPFAALREDFPQDKLKAFDAAFAVLERALVPTGAK